MKLYYPRKDGTTEYSDSFQYTQSTGKEYPLLKEAIPPYEASFIWSLYFEKLRVSSFSYAEIEAYQKVSNVTLTNWEIDLLFIIHSSVEAFISDKMKEK